MRLWSIHPQYLDTKGLIAVWREGLLAKKVLEGKTKGYTHHPQLLRFQQTNTPVLFLQQYLYYIWEEATNRSFQFNREKCSFTKDIQRLPVHKGQLLFEWNHLQKKLEKRVPQMISQNNRNTPSPHPLFYIIPGEKEIWEKSIE